MTNRINFPSGNLDHLLFEQELIREGIKYMKIDGFLYRFNLVVSFLFEDKDYPTAVKISESFQTIQRNSGGLPFLTNTDSKLSRTFFLIVIIVALVTILFIKFSERLN